MACFELRFERIQPCLALTGDAPQVGERKYDFESLNELLDNYRLWLTEETS